MFNDNILCVQRQLYKQKHGAAVGSPVSPIVLVVSLYIEQFKQKAQVTAPTYHQSGLGMYNVDTFTQIGLFFVEEFHQHLNSTDTNIGFIIEDETDDRLPFLDTPLHLRESEWGNLGHGIPKNDAHAQINI